MHDVNNIDEEALLQWAKTEYPNAKPSSSNTCYTHSEFGDKSVADGVEALIGAYYISGGLDSAARLMEWIGLRGPGPDNEKIPYGRPTTPKLTYPDTPQYQILAAQVSNLENLLNYK
jgi:hypothetical protein